MLCLSVTLLLFLLFYKILDDKHIKGWKCKYNSISLIKNVYMLINYSTVFSINFAVVPLSLVDWCCRRYNVGDAFGCSEWNIWFLYTFYFLYLICITLCMCHFCVYIVFVFFYFTTLRRWFPLLCSSIIDVVSSNYNNYFGLNTYLYPFLVFDFTIDVDDEIPFS